MRLGIRKVERNPSRTPVARRRIGWARGGIEFSTRSVTEMPHASENHRDLMLISCLDDLLISDGAPRLNDGGDTGLRSLIQAVPKREKGVRCHHAPLDLQHSFHACEFY